MSQSLTWRGPWAGRYPAAAAMVMLLLVPYLGLASAMQPLSSIIGSQLHMSSQTLSLGSGMANAGYAVGTILAVLFAQHLPQRRMLVLYASVLVAGSVLAAAAPDGGVFIAGHVLQGLCTSLLLIAAVPPLVIGFSVDKMRRTIVVMNICIFGAVAAGPLVGGTQAHFHAWRPLFWIVAGIAAVGLLLTLLTFEEVPPADRRAPKDPLALALAAAGCVAAFWGASELTTHAFFDPVAAAPLFGGFALISAFLVYQFRGRRPLLILRPLASTVPVAGIVAAIGAAAASVPAIALSSALLAGRYTPLHLGLLYVPELGGAILSAFAFAAVFLTRRIHTFTLAGLVLLAAGILVIGAIPSPTGTLAMVGSGVIGFGISAAVVPALFIAGFALINSALQRVIAVVELLRAIAAFMAAPILQHFAATGFGGPESGTSAVLWICFGFVVVGTLVGVSLYALGGFGTPAPDAERFMAGEGPAWYSPPLLARVRATPSVRRPAGRRGAVRDEPAVAGEEERVDAELL